MNQKARGPAPPTDKEEPGETSGIYPRILVDVEVARALQCIPGDWMPEERQAIRERALAFLYPDAEAGPAASPVLVRRVVRLTALAYDLERILDARARAGQPISLEALMEEIRQLRLRLGKLNDQQWLRFMGFITLRWVAESKAEANQSGHFVTFALRITRNVLDATNGSIWKLLESASMRAWGLERAYLLWHLHQPTVELCEDALAYLKLCTHGKAFDVRKQARRCRLQHDEQQQRATEAWEVFRHAVDRDVAPGSELEGHLMAWVDRHLVAQLCDKPIKDRTLLERLFYANRPDEEARRDLREILARGPARLIAAWTAMDEAVRAAEAALDAWHDAQDALQDAIEKTPNFFELRDNFLRSLANAHERPAKG